MVRSIGGYMYSRIRKICFYMRKRKYLIYCLLISFAVALAMLAKSQPQNNICDTLSFRTATTYPLTPTSISLDVSSKMLFVGHSDNPNGFWIKKIYALRQSGNRGYLQVTYWEGIQCQVPFYDYSYGQTEAEIEEIVRVHYPRAQRNGEAFMKYEVSSVNGGVFDWNTYSYQYISSPISTNYFKP